jgi:hypothetical protein
LLACLCVSQIESAVHDQGVLRYFSLSQALGQFGGADQGRIHGQFIVPGRLQWIE